MFFSIREKTVLKELSLNSRTSLSAIAKKIGCSYVTVGKIIDKLKEELDIRFVLELDLIKLGFLQRHILMVKFRRTPSQEWLALLVKNDKSILAAYLTEGQFDMVVMASESDPMGYLLWEFRFIQKLSEYGGVVKSSDMPEFIFGFLPVDNAFIGETKMRIKTDDKILLQLLNENSRTSLSELARRLGMRESTISYKIFKLTKSGVIRRFTIAVQKPPQGYILGLFEQWFSFSKGFEARAELERKHMLNIDEQTPTLTTFQMAAPLSGSYGNFIIGLFNSEKEAMENAVKKHRLFYSTESYEEKHARVLRPVKGLLPLRNLDIKQNYVVVKWK